MQITVNIDASTEARIRKQLAEQYASGSLPVGSATLVFTASVQRGVLVLESTPGADRVPYVKSEAYFKPATSWGG